MSHPVNSLTELTQSQTLHLVLSCFEFHHDTLCTNAATSGLMDSPVFVLVVMSLLTLLEKLLDDNLNDDNVMNV